MRINSRQIKSLVTLAVILVLFWIGFAPIQLGGPVSYIIINGNSMEPEIEVGDLVLVRKSASYQLDQRVIYSHPQLGYVFHRIVDQVDDRYILQGDNNDWLDAYYPLQDEILGKFWYVIPGAGKVIASFRQPLLFTLFVLILSSFMVGLVLMPDQNPPNKRKRKRKRMPKERSPLSLEEFRLEILLILVGIAAVALIFGLFALGKDAKITITDDLTYQHRGDLSYSAKASGTIYDSAAAETGDPVYPALTCLVDLDFTYQFSSPHHESLEFDQYQGTISLWAEIRDSDGWHRTLGLVPEVGITSQKVNLTHSLNICQILDLIDHKEAQTGVFLTTYTLTIKPEIVVEGRLNGLVIEDEFQPAFTFDLTDAVLRVPKNNPGFLIEEEGLLPYSFQVNNLMNLLGKQVSVSGVRWTAFIILGVCVLAAVYPGWLLLQEWQASDRYRIEFQHRPVMIDLKDSQIRKEVYTVIDLEKMADLRKLADRYGAMIMHEVEGPIHRYLVVDEGFLYQYETEAEIEPKHPVDPVTKQDWGDVEEDA